MPAWKYRDAQSSSGKIVVIPIVLLRIFWNIPKGSLGLCVLRAFRQVTMNLRRLSETCFNKTSLVYRKVHPAKCNLFHFWRRKCSSSWRVRCDRVQSLSVWHTAFVNVHFLNRFFDSFKITIPFWIKIQFFIFLKSNFGFNTWF